MRNIRKIQYVYSFDIKPEKGVLEMGNFINNYIVPNIAYILVFVSVCYVGTFIYMTATKKSFRYGARNLIGAILVLLVALYCLFTGTNLTEMIN